MTGTLHCSIGVIVYNEADNIGKLLDTLSRQRLTRVMIDRIIVVSSASVDGTDEIVREWVSRDPKIQLITESERRGKSSAINQFLKAADSDFLVIESGDTLPALDTVEKLVCALDEPDIGMAGGRPVPENPDTTFIGYCVNLLWRLHHRMASISPKLGEMIAFRNIVREIPARSAVDEASIEAVMRDHGLRLKYVGDAIVHNKGPETLADFIIQRKRIATGHYWLSDRYRYRVVSQDHSILFRITLDELRQHPSQFLWLFGAVALEAYCRLAGWIEYRYLGKNPFTWKISRTTKKLDKRV